MKNKVQISCFFFKNYNTDHDFAVQLQMDRSPRLLGVRCWNLNCDEIGDHIFSFPHWVDTLSSRSPRVSKDRGTIHIVFTQSIHQKKSVNFFTMGMSWDDKLDFTISGFTLPRNIIVSLWVNVRKLTYNVILSIRKETQFDYFLVAVEDRAAEGNNWVGLW